MKVKGSYLWAGAIVIGLAAWLGSEKLLNGAMDGSGAGDAATAAVADASGPAGDDAAAIAKPPPAVRVSVLKAQKRLSHLVVRGRTEAARRVNVAGETTGTVVDTPAQEGRFVHTGKVLCQLDMADREVRRIEAETALELAILDFDVAKNLSKKGYGAKNKEVTYKAHYNAAQAALTRAELEISRTRIVAPFDGIVEQQVADVGSFISIGGTCATLVELSPLLVVSQVGEREVGQLSLGMPATARLATGQQIDGKVRYIGSSSDVATRTFRVEIEVPNTDLAVKDGVTAEISVPLEPVDAHVFSAAVLTLRDDGAIGVRIVNAEDIVEFVPVHILASDKDGVWVSGLPPSPTVITVGHEYVRAGQKVAAVAAKPAEMAENAQ